MKRRSRKSVALILCLAVCMALFAACAAPNEGGDADITVTPQPTSSQTSSASPSQPAMPTPVSGEDEEEIVYADHITAIVDDFAVMNPLNSAGSGGGTNWAYGMIHSTLIRYDEPTNTLQPQLATEWSTEDYQTFTLKLRDDAYWHNGDKFTAQDVIWTHNAAVNGPGGYPSFDYWTRIESITALDEYTIEVKLFSPHVDFYFGMTMLYMGILNERAITEDPERGYWIGTGPFRITEFSSHDHINFERFDDYWGELPKTKTQTWFFIPEATTRTIMMQNNEAQLCFTIAETDLSMFQEDEDFEVYIVSDSNPVSLNLNQDDPLMTDENFRLAVAHALDRDEVGLFSMGEIVTFIPDGALWGLYHPYRNTDIPIYPHDIELAKQYLADSPYNGETIMLTTAQAYMIRAAQAVQQQLAEAGIVVEIEQLDTSGFAAATTWTENKTRMNIWRNLLGGSPFGFKNNTYPGATHNRSKLVNDELTALLDAQPTLTDPAELEANFKRCQEIVFETNTIMPLFNRSVGVVARASMGGVYMPTTLTYDLKYAYMVEEG